MSLTTCIRRAGSALNAEDKAAILKVAAAYRKGGMSAADAGRKAVDERIAAVQGMLSEREQAVADGTADQPAQATHADPGEAPEAATQAVVTEAIKTAAENRDRKPSEMRAELLAMIDAKMPDAKDEYLPEWKAPTKAQIRNAMVSTGLTNEARIVQMLEQQHDNRVAEATERIGFVTFKVPGDGTFKVLNTKNKLEEFRKRVSSSPGFRGPARMPSPEGSSGGEKGYGGNIGAITGMIDEGDPQAAVDYAAARGLDIAEVLKGDKARLGKVAGLTPTEAEAVGEFEPEAASLPELIQAYKSAKDVERALADAKNVNLSELARAVDATRAARAPLVEKLAEQPALSAKNSNGLLRIVAGSAQKPGQWQLTRFDQNGEPWGDSQYATQESAIDDFLREVDIDTLEMGDAQVAAPAAQEPAEPTTLTNNMGQTLDLGKPVWQATDDELVQAVKDSGTYLGKPGSKYDPYMAWRDAHSAAIQQAKRDGKKFPDEVLYDKPSLIRDDLSDNQADEATDAMVDVYRATKDYGKAVQAYRDWGKRPAAPAQQAQEGEATITREQESALYDFLREQTGDNFTRYELIAKKIQRAADGTATEDDAKIAADWLEAMRADGSERQRLAAEGNAKAEAGAAEAERREAEKSAESLADLRAGKAAGNERYRLFLSTMTQAERDAMQRSSDFNAAFMAFIGERSGEFKRQQGGTQVNDQDAFTAYIREWVSNRANPASKTPTIDAHTELFKAIRAGTATPEAFKAMYARIRDGEEAVKAELNTSTKDQLLKDISGYVRPGTTKGELVGLIYDAMLRRFALGKEFGPQSYFMGQEAAYRKAKRDALDALVEGQTAESLAEYAAEANAEFEAEVARRTALVESVKDPKTLEDFQRFMRLHTSEGKTYAEARMMLTPEQRATFDDLAASETRGRRKVTSDDQRTQVRVAGQTVDGEIIATKHTKKGHDLFVVRLSERVSREDYNTLNAGAKRIGGYYSSFRGGGAIPGFQFTTRDQADAFVKLAGGDNSAAREAAQERRDAFADDRSQTAAERLTEMADRIEEAADESMGRERKANTARRARFAAAAESAARESKAMAKTMRNVAAALTAGRAKFLDRIRTKSQVELLQTYVANAQGEELRAKYPSYVEQERRKGAPPTMETADYAEFPTFTAYRSDLASLGRQLLEVEGTKALGQRLMKVADDVGEAFTAWVKEPGNFYKVGVFSTKDGKRAMLPSKDAAERAIARSGFRGKAIPWSIKRGEWTVIMSPSEAIAKGLWDGDGDKRITLSSEFGGELVEKMGRANRRGAKVAVPWQFERAHERRKQLARMGLETPAEFRAALREFIGLREQAQEADRIKAMERAMIGKAKDGLDFFPTPESVADEMIAAADIQPNMAVLEPSAGMGHIADRIRAAGAEPEVVEMAEDRRELLQEKGYYLQPYRDFLQMEPRKFFTFGDVMRAPDGTEGIMHGGPGWSGRASLHAINEDGTEGRMLGWYDRDELVGVRHRGFRGNDAGGYDRIVMNPPFSDGRDIQHVRHAYTLLKPGGRIVALMGESAFTNQNKRATEFREWLDSVGGTDEKLAEGSFMDPSLPVNTGANARMVVIDKPDGEQRGGDDAPAFRRGPEAEAKLTNVQQAVDTITATWANPPEVRVVWDLQDPAVDERIRAEDARQRRGGATGTPLAVYDSGTVYIVASAAQSDMDVARSLFHEGLGHAGLRAAFGDSLKPMLAQMVKTNRAAVEAKAREYGLDMSKESDALRAAEEVLAELAETRPTSTWVKRAISAIRQWLRDNLPGIFGDMELSDADIVARFIVPARDAIVRGGEAQGADAVPRFMRGDEPPFSRRTDLQAEAKAIGLPATGPSERIERLVNIAKADPITWTREDFDLIAPHLSVHQDTRAGAEDRINTILSDGLIGGMVDSVGDMASGDRWTWSGGLMGKPAYVFISGALKYQGGGNPRLAPGNKPLFAIRPGKGQDFFSALQTAMSEKASSGLPLFRRGGADAGKTAAQDLVNAKGGIFDFNRLGETRQDRVRTVIDGAREFWLGGLTRDQIADVYGEEMPPVRDYDTLTRNMENERQKRAQDADKLYNEWSSLDQDTNDKLGRIMLDATVYQVHPDEADPPAKADGKARMIHARIRREYESLPQEARDIYGKVKAFHKQTLADLQAAVEARIDRQVENGQAKAAALTNVRKMFDQYLQGGPYFPLSRFGDYLVIGKRESDGEKVVAAYETAGEQQAAARALEADGFTVKTKTAKAYSRQMDGAAGKFIGDVMQAVEKLDMVEATVNGSRSDLKNQLVDDLNQMFIRALPDLSYRKHFLHRKNTPGFSADVMRGFASSAFHAASHIARLNHGDQMTFALSDAYQTIESAPEGDFNKHVQVLNELAKRHDIALNPNTHPIASMLNQVGFVMYLGLSPAAGLVNLLQTPMVTLPHLGARYGFGKATASLGKATKDIMAAPMNKQSGWDATASDKLTADEKKAMAELQDEGIIDLTQAHDLAAASGLDTGNVARSKAAFAMARAMKIVGWTFHVPEVMNRQATALSAYRLEMEVSGDAEKAKDAAREAIKRTHFDYSSSNRARYFQGNIARVVLQFKQYAQNMTYLLGRAAQQALQGETPEVRRIARRQLVATMGATWAMAGTLGLPALGAVMGAIGSMVDMLDDDDEPWDWKVEFRNLLADTFGQEAGEVIAHGLPRALMPWDVSGRVGMGELWFRSNDREGQSPREAYATDIANILGPTAGTALGWYTAADHMQRGAYDKAVEAIVPKFIRDPLKAYRESTEGVTTYTGEPVMETTAAEEIGRLLGFAPANVSEMYEAKGAVMNAKTAIEEKRKNLLAEVVKARLAKDADAERQAREEIRAFNKRNPRQAITSESIRRSLRNRQRNRDNREAGILLPESQEYLRERGRFAAVE